MRVSASVSGLEVCVCVCVGLGLERALTHVCIRCGERGQGRESDREVEKKGGKGSQSGQQSLAVISSHSAQPVNRRRLYFSFVTFTTPWSRRRLAAVAARLLPPTLLSLPALARRTSVPCMEHVVDTETPKCFHTETPPTANHHNHHNHYHHATDRGWPLFSPDQIASRRARSAMFTDTNFHRNHWSSRGSPVSDSDDDRLSLYSRRNTLPYHHVQHTPSRQPQFPPLPFRRPSQASNSSASSSTSTSPPAHPPSNTPATGRKVAANLQLFKETTPDVSALSHTDRSSSRPPTTKQETPQIASPNEGEEVGETRFVRRTAWPDREAAAIRRGKSTISLKRLKTRDSDAFLSSHDGETVPEGPFRKERAPSLHPDIIHDLVDFSPETLDRGRARERERPAVFPPPSTPLTPSISPIQRRLVLRPRLGSRRSVQSSVAFQEPPPSPTPAPAPALKHTRRGSSATRTSPVLLTNQVLTPPPPPSVPPLQDVSLSLKVESPWSTDDDSAWDTTSVASSLATTTSPSFIQHDLPDLSTTPSATRTHYSPDASALDDEDEAAYGTFDELDLSTAPLPNVPLKRFKNQVGGHSAIYKFTKRAVCKVRMLSVVS